MKLAALVVVVIGLVACRSSAPSWIPLTAQAREAPSVTLVWVGRGECERLEDGRWVRRPEFDYEFSVEQHRRGTHWSSVKSLRRRHPSYDGSAGPRAQTYFFEIDYAQADGAGRRTGRLASSLGAGTLHTDRDFRTAEMEGRANVSR